MRFTSLFLLTTLFTLRHVANALRNITLDDTSTLITYSGQWVTAAPSPLDYGGTHQYSLDPTATASFTFTGVAIYYMAPLWPYSVTTQLSLDGAPPVLVSMQDMSVPATPLTGPEIVQSQAIWGMSGLANTQHTLIASMQGSNAEVEMDGLIYTAQDAADLPGASTASKTSPPTKSTHSASKSAIHSASASASASASSSSHRAAKGVAGVVVGTIIGLCVLAAFLITGCMIYRRRRNHRVNTTMPSYFPGMGAGLNMGKETGEDRTEVGDRAAYGYPYGVPNIYPFSAEHQPQGGFNQRSGTFENGGGDTASPPNNFNSNTINHPYSYPSENNTFCSIDQHQQFPPPVQAPAPAPVQNLMSPTFPYPDTNQPFLNPFADWASVQSASVPSQSHPVDTDPNAHRLSTLTGRESIVGLAYLRSEADADPTPAPTSVPVPSRTRTMVVMNGDNDGSCENVSKDAKSDWTQVPTQRQEDGSIPPPPAYTMSSTE